jgi:hypothetical protein
VVVMKRSIFWDIMPYSPLKVKMEVTCSSRTSVDFQWAVQYYISENRTLHHISDSRINHILLVMK